MSEITDRLDELEDRIIKLESSIDKASKAAERLTGSLGDTNNIIGDAAKRMLLMAKNARQFTFSLKDQYKLAEGLAESYKQTSVQIGISVTKQHEFGKAFIKSTAEAEALGGKVEDVQSAYSSFVEASGRARIVRPEEIKNIIALEKGTGLVGDSASKLMERFDLMGKSAESSMAAVNSIYVDSLKLGLNASKVTKELADSFSKMQTYSFRGGVKGMTRMAQLAVQMRVDVGTMLGMADKFYEPEAAIEAAANLQMLGGDIAKAFGDPFETMYLARNKPEELAKRVQEMTENMIQFNSETGEYEFPAEARMQLKSAGEQLGINVDQMIDIARQSSKIKDIKMQVSGNMFDDTTREGIASLARLDKNNNWVVDFEGKPIDIGNASELQDAVNSGLLDVPTNEKDAILVTAKEAMTTNQYLDSIDKSIKTRFVSDANVYMATETALRGPISAYIEEQRKLSRDMADAFGDTEMAEAIKKMENMVTGGAMSTEEYIKKQMGGIREGLQGMLKDGKLDVKSMDIKKVEIENFLLKRQDVTGGGRPDVTGMPVDLASGNKVDHSGNIVLDGNITIDAGALLPAGTNFDELKPKIQDEIIKLIQQQIYKGGVPSSREVSDIIK